MGSNRQEVEMTEELCGVQKLKSKMEIAHWVDWKALLAYLAWFILYIVLNNMRESMFSGLSTGRITIQFWITVQSL